MDGFDSGFDPAGIEPTSRLRGTLVDSDAASKDTSTKPIISVTKFEARWRQHTRDEIVRLRALVNEELEKEMRKEPYEYVIVSINLPAGYSLYSIESIEAELAAAGWSASSTSKAGNTTTLRVSAKLAARPSKK